MNIQTHSSEAVFQLISTACRRGAIQMRTTLCTLLLCLSTGCAKVPELPLLPVVDTTTLLPVVASQLDEVRARLERHDQDANVNGEYGLVLATYGRDQEARVAFERARLLAPDNDRWPAFQSFVLRRLGQPDDALEAIDAALALSPHQVDYHVRRAQLFYDGGQFDQARRVVDHVLHTQPNYPLARFYLGRLFMIENEWEQAITQFEGLLKSGIAVEEVHFNLSQAHRMTGNAKQSAHFLALAQRGGALKINGYDPVYIQLAGYNVGDQPHVLRATQYYRRGKISEAVAEMAIAHEKNPDNIGTHVHLVRMYGHNRQLDKALFHYEAARSVDPEFNQLDSNLGFAYRIAGDDTKAAAAYQRAIRLSPSSADLHTQLGLALVGAGQSELAIAPLSRSLELAPGNRRVQIELGELLLDHQRFEEAMTLFDQSLEPEDQMTVTVLQRIATAHEQLGNPAAARGALSKGLAIAEQYGNDQLAQSLRDKIGQLQ